MGDFVLLKKNIRKEGAAEDKVKTGAGDAKNIEFLTPKEHLEKHGGNWKNQTTE